MAPIDPEDPLAALDRMLGRTEGTPGATPASSAPPPPPADPEPVPEGLGEAEKPEAPAAAVEAEAESRVPSASSEPHGAPGGNGTTSRRPTPLRDRPVRADQPEGPALALRPHDDEEELALVGAALLFGDDALRDAAPIVSAEDFYGGDNGKAYALLLEGHERGEPLDSRGFVNVAEARGLLHRSVASELVMKAMDACPTGAMVSRSAHRVLELSRRRKILDLGHALTVAGNSPSSVEEGLALVRDRLEELQRVGDAGDLISLPLAEAMTRPAGDAEALVGAHVLDAGGLCVVGSEPGLGKTHCLLALALDLSRGGGSFLGLSLPETPRRVLYGWGEGGLARFQDRLRTLLGSSTVPESFRVLIPRSDAPDLSQPSGLAVIRREIQAHRADLFIADTVSEWSSHEENDPTEGKRFIRAINGLRRGTGCAIALSHHTRKPGQFSSAGSAQELRGATTLAGAADSVLLLNRDGERVLATWGKLRNAPQHPALFLKFNAESGRFDIVGEKAPSSAPVSTSKDVIVDALEAAGGSPRTYEALEKATGLSRRTLERRLPPLVSAGTVKSSGGSGTPAAFWIPIEGQA